MEDKHTHITNHSSLVDLGELELLGHIFNFLHMQPQILQDAILEIVHQPMDI